jgi:hypothetical protein
MGGVFRLAVHPIVRQGRSPTRSSRIFSISVITVPLAVDESAVGDGGASMAPLILCPPQKNRYTSFVATLAQLAEHFTRNEKVRSSILRGGSTCKTPDS